MISNSFAKTQSIAGALIRLADEGTVESHRANSDAAGAIRELQSDHPKIRGMLTPFVINGWLTPHSCCPTIFAGSSIQPSPDAFGPSFKNQTDMIAAMKKRMSHSENAT